MLPLRAWPRAARQGLTGVLTDIDDTLTTEGAITPEALQALAALQAAGLPVIAITGRPVGWSEPFALAWPLVGIVAENGAVTLTRGEGGLRKLYAQEAAERAANFARMQRVAQRILREVPGAQLSRDSGGRETDIAIDHSEFAQLPPERIAQVVALMRAEGMNATVSSIHVNGWYGDHDKLSGARWAVRALLGRELDTELERWVYVGDSTNDARMFEHFPHSVGVANIRRFEAALAVKPRYVTEGERGVGFAEVVSAVLGAPLG
jgi:hypothetical protein